METVITFGNGQAALNREVFNGVEVILSKLYPEFKEWNSIFSEPPEYVNFLREHLTNVMFMRDENEPLDDYFVDLGVPTSDMYVKWYREMQDVFFKLGWTSEYFGPIRNGYAIHHELFSEAPWENEFYNALVETNDYWWFLVCVFSKLGSVTLDGRPSERTAKLLLSFEKENIGGFSLAWFEPLGTWIKKYIIMEEYKKTSFKSISDFNFNNLNVSLIPTADISNTPEYDLDKYINYKGKYYEPFELFKAITASGGFAQALERQDLEPRLTNVASLIRKKRKEKNGRKKK
jgi:hypothetical protein